ncbi:nucleotidyltransferase [Clostridia bacterium]|nr:nucleotidyltransferase [Clostridia bacterium]
MPEQVRWKQRFCNFSRAFLRLRDALYEKELEDFDELQQEGIVQRFEYTFELFWKTLKDYLEQEGVAIEVISPKYVISAAASSKVLEHMGADGELLLEMVRSRNLMSHTYDFDSFRTVLTKVKNEYFGQMDRAYTYFLKQDKLHE